MTEFFLPAMICFIGVVIGCYIASFALVTLSVVIGGFSYSYWFIQGRFPWNKKF